MNSAYRLRATEFVAWVMLRLRRLRCAGCFALILGIPFAGCGPSPGNEIGAGSGIEAGVSLDGGVDDFEVPDANFGEPCSALLLKTCGETCAESPGCKAATLLAEHAPDECPAALEQPVTFPACSLNFCESLLFKTCGSTTDLNNASCADDPGCKTARSIVESFTDGGVTLKEDETTLSSCLQALEDEFVFFPCENNG